MKKIQMNFITEEPKINIRKIEEVVAPTTTAAPPVPAPVPAPMSFEKFAYREERVEKESLSPEQEKAFCLFKEGKNLFITGAGGTGKTKLISTFKKYIEEKCQQKNNV